MKQLDAYEKAYQLALDNAEIWLGLARSAFDSEYFGHAFALTCFANEEVTKAMVSWMVSQKYYSPDDEIVKEVYSWHVTKGRISLEFHYMATARHMLEAGLLNQNDLLREVVTIQEDQTDDELWAQAYDMEDWRKAGIYVDVRKNNDGTYSAASPLEFPRKRIVYFIDSVGVYLSTIKLLIHTLQTNEEARRLFESL